MRVKFQDDNIYIERVLKGEVAVFSYLVEKHKEMVFTIAMKVVHNREDAEEIAQDAFLKAYQALKTFKKESKFATWMYRIVYNTAISKTRKKQMELAPLDDIIIDNFTTDEIHESAGRLSDEEQSELINQAIQQLPEDESLLLMLFYKKENSVEDISQITGLSSSNVKVKLHRIRKKLYAELNEQINVKVPAIN